MNAGVCVDARLSRDPKVSLGPGTSTSPGGSVSPGSYATREGSVSPRTSTIPGGLVSPVPPTNPRGSVGSGPIPKPGGSVSLNLRGSRNPGRSVLSDRTPVPTGEPEGLRRRRPTGTASPHRRAASRTSGELTTVNGPPVDDIGSPSTRDGRYGNSVSITRHPGYLDVRPGDVSVSLGRLVYRH